MAFITNDGSVLRTEPWGRRSVSFFLGIVHVFFTFFRSLFSPILTMLGPQSEDSDSYGTSTRNFRPGSGPPRPPRRISGFSPRSNISTPGPCASCG